MAALLYRLGRFSARRRWAVVLSWIVVLVIAGVSYGAFSGTISSSITIPGTATTRVTDELAEHFPSASGGGGTIVFETTDGTAFTAAQRAGVATTMRRIGDIPKVRTSTDPFATQARLTDQRQELADGREDIADGRRELTDAQDRLDDGRARLRAGQEQLDQQVDQAKAAGQYAPARTRLEAAQQQIDAQGEQLDAGQRTIDRNTATLRANEREVAAGQQVLDLSKGVRFVSEDGSAALANVSVDSTGTTLPAALQARIIDRVDTARIAGVRALISNDLAQTVPSVIGPAEIAGLLLAAIVLLVALSTVIGAVLPLVSALFGVGVSVLGGLAFSGIVEFVSVTPVLGVMLGTAVGIDYSLFILNRHRTQLKRGMELHESIGVANSTSGNAVVFAGTTVVVALVALNVTAIPFLGLMGTVAAASVVVAILVAVTFTPALLSLVGPRVLRRRERPSTDAPAVPALPSRPMPTWRAIVVLVAGIAVLGTLALPALQLRLGLPDGSSNPVDSTQYRAFEVVEQRFGPGRNGPLLVVADLPAKATGTHLLQQEATIGGRLAEQTGVVAVLPIGASSDHRIVAFQVIPTGGPSSVSTERLVHDLRGLPATSTGDGDVTLGVAGTASANIDISQKLADVLPLYLAVVVGLSLIILVVVFRSFLVPLIATAGFVLSLLASLGGLTAVYQFGWLHQVFGVHDPGPLLSFEPIIEMGILFGLAMDYQLFLVSGMREAHVHGASAGVAVQRGLHAGRRVVTAAAVIMISVFAGFIFSDSSTIQPVGFGLAFGVLVDAFVVRMLLIPAAMHLLGRSAWWFPEWLDRVVPNVDVEGAQLRRPAPAPAAAEVAEHQAV